MILTILVKKKRITMTQLTIITSKNVENFLWWLIEMLVNFGVKTVCRKVKHELRVQNSTSYEFKSTSYEVKSTSYEFKSTLRTLKARTEGLKARVGRLKA